MSFEFFNHMYAPGMKRRAKKPPIVSPEKIEITGHPDALVTTAKQLGCGVAEVQDQLQLIHAIIAGRIMPTEKDIEAIQKRADEEHAEVMRDMRRKGP